MTLVWPSLFLYNRVGNCTIKVISFRATGGNVDHVRTMNFNTTINTRAFPDYLLCKYSWKFLRNFSQFHLTNFSDYFNDMKRENGYTKCASEDLDPFNNCKPVNCEEKYFGKRNFFQSPNCVPATICSENDDSIYDYTTNECRSFGKVLSDDDLSQIKNGNFTNWVDAKEVKETSANVFHVKFHDNRKKILN